MEVYGSTLMAKTNFFLRCRCNSRFSLQVFSLSIILVASNVTGADVEKRLVLDVDFAFDGGSLVFELADTNENKESLAFINPKSYLVTKNPSLSCYWSSNRTANQERPVEISKESATKLIVSIASNDQTDNHVRDSCLALLLANQAKVPIKTWGTAGVAAIKKGRWNLLLLASQEDEELDDPFRDF